SRMAVVGICPCRGGGNPLSRCTSGAPIRLRRGLTSPSLHGTVADGVESRVGHISPVGYPPSVICRTAHNPTLFVEQGFLPLPPQFRCSSVPLRDTPVCRPNPMQRRASSALLYELFEGPGGKIA